MKTWGYLFLGLAGLFLLLLLASISSVGKQIAAQDRLVNEYSEVFFPAQTDPAIVLAKRLFEEMEKERKGEQSKFLSDVVRAQAGLDEINRRTNFEWRESQASRLAVQLTSFSKPESIRNYSVFWPGLTAVTVFGILGMVLFLATKRSSSGEEESSPFTLDD